MRFEVSQFWEPAVFVTEFVVEDHALANAAGFLVGRFAYQPSPTLRVSWLDVSLTNPR